MLYEIPHVRQTDRSYIKRWLTCSDMDLFIWFRESVPLRFQLAYDKQNREKAISWDRHRGFRHYLVDSGETLPDHYKQTPMLTGLCGQHDITVIAREFLAASEKIDAGLSDFIYARLMEHPVTPGKNYAAYTDHQPL